MSGPFKSLDKNNRLKEKRYMPFRSSIDSFDEKEFMKDFAEGSKKVSKPALSAPDDNQLWLSMIKRISMLEKQNLSQSRELIEKEKQIKVLEDKVNLDKNYKLNIKKADEILKLEKKCQLYEKQIYEMEKFLSDYGLVWVGDDDSSNNESESTCLKGNEDEETYFIPNFDVIINNIEKLNRIAGEGEHKIHKTYTGATLKVQETVPLKLFANGILLFEGPFRPFTDNSTQRCLLDIIDGYFPSELQKRFPDGVPIKVTDQRNVTYVDPKHRAKFPGLGRKLDDESKYKGDNVNKNIHGIEDLNKPFASTLNFIEKLPESVVKKGKVIKIRDEIKSLITDNDNKKTVFENENVASSENKHGNKSIENKTTKIRVNTEDKVFNFELSYKQTLLDLQKAIDSKREPGASSYDIVTSFPKKIYTNLNETLYECGLVPTANVHLKYHHQ